MILKFSGYLKDIDNGGSRGQVTNWEISAYQVKWILPYSADVLTIRFIWLGQEVSVRVVGEGIDFIEKL